MINKENIKYLTELTDDAIKLKGILELFDGILIKEVIQAIDKYILDEYAPPEVEDEINILIDAIEAKDKEQLTTSIGTLTGLLLTWVLQTWAIKDDEG